ncbi:RHS repeat-associated core domain-containing protein [Vibrio sp. J1-1]|uniref:RHS repeat domain-containing protein n=1 Tax=Vibrio sp. J1-1 TaxID=2912251 RepID=UPI001F3C7FC6
MQFIDHNADGYLDFYVDGKVYINQREEVIFDVSKSLVMPKNVYHVDDINGDGIDDYVTYAEERPPFKASKVHLSTGVEIDRINVIKEHARTFKIKYKSAADQTVHVQKRYFDYPFLNSTPAKQLVSDVIKEPKGYAATRYSYRYEGAKSHALGGGFLGFAKITEVESEHTPLLNTSLLNTSLSINALLNTIHSNNSLLNTKYDFVSTTTVSEYHQLDLNKAGELKSVSVYKQGKGARPFVYNDTDKVSSTEFVYQSTNRTKHAFQVYPKKVIKKSYELGVLQKTETISRVVNTFGALTREESTVVSAKHTQDTFATRIDNTYVSNGYPATSKIAQRVTQAGNEYWKVGALKHSITVVTDQQHGLSKSTQLDYSYSSQGMVTSVRTSGSEYEPGSGAGRYLTIKYRYDAWGNVLEESKLGSDLKQRTTIYSYEGNGLKLKATTNAKGHTTTWEYDAQGRLLSETSALKGRKTSYQYDSFGRETFVTLPGSGNVVRQRYHVGRACANAVVTTAHCMTVTKADGSEQQTHYDYNDREVRRLHRAFDGRWIVVDTEWDANGRKRFVTAAKFLKNTGEAPRVTFDYDFYDREIRRVEPANRGGLSIFTTRYQGYKIESTDARGFKSSTTHNVMGHVIRKDEPLGAYQTYQYYPDGKLKRTVDSAGNVTQVKYDNLGYRTELDDPDIGHWYYRYNALGQLVYQQDANGVVTTIDYDPIGRKVDQKEGDENSQWHYDERGALGTLSWFSGKGQRTDYFYNRAGLLQEKAVTVGQEIFSTQYEYDKFERLGREVRPDGKTLKSALGKEGHQRLAIEYLYNQYGYLGAVRSPRTYADDIFTSAKFREDIRQLLNDAISQANSYLQRANRYSRQEQFFRTKQVEYERKRIDVYNLDSTSAALLKGHQRYKQWCDVQQTCYLRPAKWVMLHNDITIPLDVTLEGEIYRITSEKEADTGNSLISGLQAHNLTATTISEEMLAGLSLTQAKDMLLSGDYDEDGSPDMMRQGDIYSAKADNALRGELLFAAEDLEQAANIANRQYKQYKALAADMIGLSEKVAQLSGLYCEFANDLAGTHVSNSLRQQCKHNGGVSQADMLNTVLTNSEIAESSKNEAYVYYWQRQATDAFDHTLSEMLGNGLINTYEHDVHTGRVNAIATHQGNQVYSSDVLSKPSHNQYIRYLRYQYDEHNNVTQRFDDQLGITDVWTYDALDRVETNTMVLVDRARHGLNNPDLTGKRSFRYDKLGNIRYKSDIGDYQYSGIGAGPHAVTQANGLDYQYDAAGNMLSAKAKGSQSSEKTMRWSPFNKPIKIVRNGKSVEFSYDANHNRYLKRSSDGTVTFYFGKTYERVKNLNTGEIQHKHFIFADGKLIALNTLTIDRQKQLKNKQVRYLHYDALDSVDMVTDGYGLVVEKRSYDTWGKQRHVQWQDKSAASVVQAAITNRGYTGHEEIVEVGLIHMNGRVYDQDLGRFTSADPLVQSPYVVNSFNRYSYVMNNPLKYTDPTGLSAEGSDSTGESGSTGLKDKNASSNGRAGEGGGESKNDSKPKEQSISNEDENDENEEDSGWGVWGDIAELAYDLSPISTVVDVANATVDTVGALAAGEFQVAAQTFGSAVFGVVAKKVKAPAKFVGSVYNKVTKRSADGRLRNADGTFAYDGGPKKSSTNSSHGNTRTPDTEATLYGKFDANGNFEKWGISQDASTRYSAKELAGGRIKEYRRGPRDQMLDRERRLVERFPGPKNNEPWAGSRRPK